MGLDDRTWLSGISVFERGEIFFAVFHVPRFKSLTVNHIEFKFVYFSRSIPFGITRGGTVSRAESY
jgi:hypothetical protein